MAEQANDTIVVSPIAAGNFLDDVWVLYDAIVHAQIEVRLSTPNYVVNPNDPVLSILILEALAKTLASGFEERGHPLPAIAAWNDPAGYLDRMALFLFDFLDLLPKTGETVH